ncbi:TrkH family potassium uptake protein [Haloferax mediterranei ATCC 33500]|uniref:Potassium transport system protein trkH1 n=1 Tax=Haloferax mediterranei (strain ATCC 33500 / DSM 1411 / JCM 8866 / NBRC 14739 / NCIMB 2177 / R-4) TaxID=523841 RepID=I3R0Q0_HALMT|nr:TrkH family potassium uptake protein [Haloferax mediterranei]AFK17810.1 potassium transport system protein trkH1 [Haloferax mediterranei ATCC 33500]AHZ22764.1 potassium transporter Trk [Haloferax mediterranei ATCC 33500]EMA02918.1 potassium transport system protein trkH1 [Haloferax mediterranei ATCC 33500]MDX5987899.1 TrkH family potassium uptake protein [Haloferax mediterranei ATCC 33500]QCQ74373.1 TrkH family potassium uptake protein [Haloferax mediterranei ATCC 33500]
MNGSVATVGRDLGRILEALGGLMLVSLVVPVIWGEYYALPALLISAIIPLGIGRLLYRRFRNAEDPGRLHGMVVAALGWFSVGVFGSLPFLLIAWSIHLGVPGFTTPDQTATLAAFTEPLNAIFESMSGFTGTGLTMTDNEEVLPRTLQWWRTFSEWVGGVGVIVLTTAVLSRPGSGSLTLYESEARSEKIHPSIVSTVRTIWWIFTLFTFVSILALWLAGMPIWGAINHAMTGLSTGGFSITDNSIATYDSAVIDFVLVPIMLLGSIAFPVHYLILQGDLRNFYSDLQTRWVFIYMSIGSALLWSFLYFGGPYETPFDALRYGLFQFVSAATCTGFQTAVDATNVALGRWPAYAQLTVTFGMFVGGAAGSTVGGIKLIRGLTLVKGIRYQIADVFYPQTAIRRLGINGRRLNDEEASREFMEAAIIVVLWITFLVVGTFVLLLTLPSAEYSLANVVFEVASAQGNVGLSSGITGPESLPPVGKVVFLFHMWIGRLEIIPVLVTLRTIFHRGGLYS